MPAPGRMTLQGVGDGGRASGNGDTRTVTRKERGHPVGRPTARSRAAFGISVAVQLGVLYWPRAAQPAPALPLDTAVHVLIFAAVAWAGLRAGVPAVALLALLVAHSVVSEVAQELLLPRRSGDAADVLADVSGVLLGALVAVARRRGVD